MYLLLPRCISVCGGRTVNRQRSRALGRNLEIKSEDVSYLWSTAIISLHNFLPPFSQGFKGEGGYSWVSSQQTTACGSNPIFVWCPWVKNVFYMNVLKDKGRIIFYDTWWKVYEIQFPVSINKVSLEHRHGHSFMYFLWLLILYTTVGLSRCNEDSMAHKA